MADLFDRVYLSGADSIGQDVTTGHDIAASDDYLVHELEVLERRLTIRLPFAQAGTSSGTTPNVFVSTDLYFLTEDPERLMIQLLLQNSSQDLSKSNILWFMHMGDAINSGGVFTLSTGGFNTF